MGYNALSLFSLSPVLLRSRRSRRRGPGGISPEVQLFIWIITFSLFGGSLLEWLGSCRCAFFHMRFTATKITVSTILTIAIMSEKISFCGLAVIEKLKNLLIQGSKKVRSIQKCMRLMHDIERVNLQIKHDI